MLHICYDVENMKSRAKAKGYIVYLSQMLFDVVDLGYD